MSSKNPPSDSDRSILCFPALRGASFWKMPEDTLRKRLLAAVREKADRAIEGDRVVFDESRQNWPLIRTRHVQCAVFSLLVQYRVTGRSEYREAVLRQLRQMAEWEYWSWSGWRARDSRPEADFDLSYSENSLTVAMVFDALRGELSGVESREIVDLARRRCILPYLAMNPSREKRARWFAKPYKNWNGVCNGGVGMLALVMRPLISESEDVLERVEESLQPFFESTGRSGGWPEGVAYWSYGMRYGFYYLLTWERATGRRHPLLEWPGTSATLWFPLMLSPHGVACGFGDCNYYEPHPFHLLAARRFNLPEIETEVLRRLDLGLHAPLPEERRKYDCWPTEAEWLTVLNDQIPGVGRKKVSAKRWKSHFLFGEIGLGFAADTMPQPEIYVSVRGGTLGTVYDHTHRDLLSFHCLVGDERLIENISTDDYVETTFWTRSHELYEKSAASKNTVFVNGIGVGVGTSAAISAVEGRLFRGFRLDATEAMVDVQNGSLPIAFCGRLLLLLRGRALAVIDEFDIQFAGPVESRLHTFAKTSFGADTAEIRGRRNRLHVSLAATVPTILRKGLGLPTHPPREPNIILRHMSAGKIHKAVLCSLLVPNGTGGVKIDAQGSTRRVSFAWKDRRGEASATVSFGSHLKI
jgi:hypothetical protein